MQLVLHVGAHFTENERLFQSVLRNADTVRRGGVHLPQPGTYRPALRETLNAMKGAGGAGAGLIDLTIQDSSARRLILSDANIFRSPSTAIQQGVLYPAAGDRLAHLADIYDAADLEIFLGIRNPAVIIPLLVAEAQDVSAPALWAGRRPDAIRWSDVIDRIRDAVPGAALTVWCAEDLPFIWAQVIRKILGLPDEAKVKGGLDLLSDIMSREGMERLRAYLHANKTMSEPQKQRAIAAFLEKFALPDAVEEEIDMAGWTQDVVSELSARYDADVVRIGSMPGVRLLAP